MHISPKNLPEETLRLMDLSHGSNHCFLRSTDLSWNRQKQTSMMLFLYRERFSTRPFEVGEIPSHQ